MKWFTNHTNKNISLWTYTKFYCKELYLQLKERVKELENETRIKNSTAPRIIKMRIEKAK